MPPVTVLFVDDDRGSLDLLCVAARARHLEPFTATSITTAMAAARSHAFDVALVDLSLGSESGLDAIRRLKEIAPDLEIVAVSGTASLASAIQSFDLAAFAFVQKPVDVDHLFATVNRAVERRRMNLANRRLIWEMQVINAIGEDLRRSLDQRELIDSTLRRLMTVLGVDIGGARLRNPVTGDYEMVMIGPPAVHEVWGPATPLVPRPSDTVVATGKAFVTGDLHALSPADVAARIPVRATLNVPMFAGGELIGVLSIGAAEPNRFSDDDQRLVTTIASHLAVAVQNARLHSYARVGKQQWEATFDAISDLIAVFDGQGRLLRGNLALAAHLGRPVTSLRNATCEEVGLCGPLHPDCGVASAAAAGGCVRAEVTAANGQIFSVTTCPVRDIADGSAVVQIAKNVTQEIQSARRLRQMSEELATANSRLVATVDRLKTTQAQLLQAEKLSAIGQLVAGVAHELNNPLTSVIGYAQLVEDELVRGAPEDQRPSADLAVDVRRIAEESERAARIVRNLLAFARRQTAERAPQDLAELVSRVVALRSYEFRLNGIEVETAFDEALPHVMADGGHLQQALLNLVLNAEQAMRGRTPRRLRFGAQFDRAACAVELTVSDTGHGIAEDTLRRIFDPFFTTRDVGEGTGLGLSICYGIVRDHGGQIRVQSRVGIGTTFSLLLPSRMAAALVRQTVLVAHGDQTERDYLAAIFGGWGHPVQVADSADAARAQLRAGGIDAVFLDRAFLTGDCDAWRAARKADGDRASVVLLTSADETGVIADGAEAAAVLPPPFDLRAVHAALRAVSKECV